MYHAYAKQPSCEEEGNVECYLCTNCWKYFADKDGKKQIKENSWVINATGHKWTDWKSTAYDMAKGKVTQTRTCSECNKTESKTVDLPFTRLYGKGRFETAAKISQAAFADKADTVVLACSSSYADALASAEQVSYQTTTSLI